MNLRTALFIVVGGVLLGAAIGLLLQRDEEPAQVREVEAPPAPEDASAVTSAARVVSVPENVRPTSELAPLPPDPIADRIANGEELYTLHGEVLDAVSEAPIELFRMWCEPETENIQAASAQAYRGRTFSNPLGTFTYRGLAPGTYNLFIRIEGYEELVVEKVEVPTEDEKLSLRLSRGAYIEVTVNDSEGDGVSDLEVRLNPLRLDEPERLPRVRLDFTDDYGRTRFTNLPSGIYTVAMGNAALAEYATQEFYLGLGAAYPVTFTVPDLATVQVLATDTNGEALGIVQVRMWSKSGRGVFRAETDRHGKARVRHVPAGDYTVKVYKLGFRRRNLELSVAENQSEVPLEIVLVQDERAAWEEENPTPEVLQRLKAGERPSDVFSKRDGG